MIIQNNANQEKSDLSGAMTDISFLLIVFFLVVTVFITEDGLFSKLPDENSEPRRKPVDELVQIELRAVDNILIGNSSFSSMAEVGSYIQSLTEANPALIAIVAVREGVLYKDVVSFFALLKEQGISELTVATGDLASFSSTAFPIVVPDADIGVPVSSEE